MNAKIDISYEDLLSIQTDFEKEITSMDELFQDVKKETEKFSEYWDGKDSKEVMPTLKDIENKFDGIVEYNNKYNEYLKKVVELYKTYDKSVTKVVENANKSLDINVK